MARRASFGQDFKRFFFRGLATLLPTILTVVILLWVLGTLYTYVAGPINTGIRGIWAASIAEEKGTPGYEQTRRYVAEYHDDNVPESPMPLYKLYVHYRYDRYYLLSVLSVFVALVGVYIVGYLLATFLGRSVWRLVEQSIMRVPVVSRVYPYVKQFTDFMFAEKRFEFSRVVMVEFPRRDMWSIAFVTGSGFRDLNRHTGQDMVTVYLPSAPTPFTGYCVIVPREDIVEIDVTVDALLRYVISVGVITPLNQTPPGQTTTEPAALPSPDDVDGPGEPESS